MMDATVVECVTARCQSPEAEAAAPADGAPAGSEGQQVTTPTSSPDTNSPVMVSVEVGRRQTASRCAPVIRPDG